MLKRFITYYLAPFLLLVVVGWHHYNVRARHQSQWVGGGFGMFSSVDAVQTRMLRVYIETEHGEALVVAPDLENQRARILVRPTDEVLERLARQVARRHWVLWNREQIATREDQLPEQLRLYLRMHPVWHTVLTAPDPLKAVAKVEESALYPRRIALPAGSAGDSTRVRVIAARVEVWRTLYDPGTGRLEGRKLTEVSIH